jgi:hypothetical protein
MAHAILAIKNNKKKGEASLFYHQESFTKTSLMFIRI